MIVVRVIYTVKPDYVLQNQANINEVMIDLRNLNNPNAKYASYLEEDGVTFMHFAQYPDEETAQLLNALPSFTKFRTELKASEPVVAPKSNKMTLVGTAYNIF
jgi:hypothetical protein